MSEKSFKPVLNLSVHRKTIPICRYNTKVVFTWHKMEANGTKRAGATQTCPVRIACLCFLLHKVLKWCALVNTTQRSGYSTFCVENKLCLVYCNCLVCSHFSEKCLQSVADSRGHEVRRDASPEICQVQYIERPPPIERPLALNHNIISAAVTSITVSL